MQSDYFHELPPDLPVPTDDGAAEHLQGQVIPSVPLPGTDGTTTDLASVRGRVVVFAYPRTGRPGEEPFVPEWDRIPGARGCTPQTCAFRDLVGEFSARDCRIFGLSSQDAAYQKEMADRLRLPFPVLSDSQLKLTTSLHLPTMEVAGTTLLRRLAWIADDGVIGKVFYPVFPPDRNAADVLAWLSSRRT